MPRNELLRDFVRRTVPALGQFGVHYANPLRAFLSLQDSPDKVTEVIERGMTQQSLEAELQLLLKNDRMLARCCGDVDRLAYALDILLFGPLPDPIYYGNSTLLGLGVPSNALEEQLEGLESKLYEQGEFRKTAYFHIFNMNVARDLALPDPAWRVQQVSYEQIKSVLQPGRYTEFLNAHSDRTFAVIEDNEGFDSEPITEWLTRRWREVSEFRKALQFVHDGSLDIDYVIPHFNPPWVNQVQGGGIFQMGSPRIQSDIIELKCLHLGSEGEETKSVWRLFKQYSDLSQADRGTVKRAIGIATEFYEESHRKETRIERFANLMIALEALYTPSDRSELTTRVSQTCAVLVGTSFGDDSPQIIYRFLKDMFTKRGNLFHGTYDVASKTPETFISGQELAQLYSLVRRSLIAYICLFIKGHKDLKELRRKLEDSVLDESQREILHNDCRIDAIPFSDN